MTTFRCEAPTDEQLATLRAMCLERGLEPPPVVASKDEGHRIFEQLKRGGYNPDEYRVSAGAWWVQA